MAEAFPIARRDARLFALTAIAAGLAVYAGIVVATMVKTGGVFEYPLDDPYIHLALAEQIARGTYGINPGEVASPSSSPLFPLLLTPFSGSAIHRYLPAAWNVAALIVTAWLWARLLVEAGYGREGFRRFGLLAAALGPAFLQVPQVAILGMEHTLHAAAALAVVFGLFRHLTQTGPGGPALVIAGAFLSSAFRFEGMALGLLAGMTLFFTGRRGAGLATAVAAVLPVAVFVAYLSSLGLDPMPSSIQVKLTDLSVGGIGFVQKYMILLAWNVSRPGGQIVAALAFALLALPVFSPAIRQGRLRLLAYTVAAAAAAHLVVGQVGWLNRLEHYLVVASAATFLALLPRTVTRPVPGVAFAAKFAVVALVALLIYPPGGVTNLTIGAHTVLVQQGHLARFAQDYLKTPVAVNDIGRVAWGNDQHVLDLWGLASQEAREIRQNDPAPGWTGALTDKHDIPVALIYDHWFTGGIGKDWVRVGQLDLTIPRRFLGGDSVAFYATDPKYVGMLRDRVAAWVPTLTSETEFIWEEGMEP